MLLTVVILWEDEVKSKEICKKKLPLADSSVSVYARHGVVSALRGREKEETGRWLGVVSAVSDAPNACDPQIE